MKLVIALVAVASLLVVGEKLSLQEVKNRPVSKVINVLKDMLAQLEKEASEDEEVYDQISCWCETNDKEKTKAIADAEAKITDLGVKIEELYAASVRLGTEIKTLEQEVAKNQEALDQATEIRMKELGEFNAEEKDMLAAISALKGAITALEKHNSAAMLQTSAGNIIAALKLAMHDHQDLFQGVLTHSEKRAVDAFVQQAPVTDGSYAPQSGQIFGILKQMKETFETNLADSQGNENGNQKAYDELKAAKNAEITAGQDQIDKKTDELSMTDEKLAESQEDLVDTKKTLAADEQFLAQLKETCAQVDAQWEERQKTRQLEMEACSKALAVLSSDDAKDLFAKNFNFVQMKIKARSQRRQHAAALVAKAAMKLNSPRLAEIATQIKLDAFTKVKQAIDDMVAALLQEKKDEIKHKDFCVEEFNTNQAKTEEKEREKADLDVKIDDLKMQIKTLSSDIDSLTKQIAEMQVQMKRAGEDREKENKEFQMTVADQRATQKLLNAALNILKGFYEEKKGIFNLAQQAPVPPAQFKDYSKNKQSGGVMGMIQNIIDDAKAMENEAIRGEEDAQTAYENFVKESNTSIDAKNADITNKNEEKAKADEDLTKSSETLDNVNGELDTLSQQNADLHGSCDFVMKNFDIRQTARDEEIEALKQAKAILSGAQLEE